MNTCDLDIKLFRWINDSAGLNPWHDRFGVFAAEWLVWLMVASLVVLAVVPLWKHKRGVCLVCHSLPRVSHDKSAPELMAAYAAVAALMAAVLAWIGNQLISLMIIWRDRPFRALADVHQLIDEPLTVKSFPSDHSTIAFALAFSLVFARPRLGAFMLLAAAIVALGRVFVGVHYPTDVVAGMAVGFVWAFVARLLERRLDLTAELCRLYERLCKKLVDRKHDE